MKNGETGTLYIEYMALSELWKRGVPENPKDHDIGQLHGSMDRFGYTSPVIIDEGSGRIVAGHGRIKTLIQRKEMGQIAPAKIMDKGDEWMVPVIRGLEFENVQEAEAYLLADNRISELGGWMDDKLAESLKTLALDGDLEGTGFDGDDLDRILKRLEGSGGMDVKPEVDFTEELHESHNYIVLYFDNDVDWLQALSLFDLKSVKALSSREGYEKKGVGRVMKGSEAIRRLIGEHLD